MREEWAKTGRGKQVLSCLLVIVIVAGSLLLMISLNVPRVSAQVIHLGSTSAEDGNPVYDVTPSGDYIVQWDVNEDHIMNVDYVVESGWTLLIPALNYQGDPTTEHEITVEQPINITVQTGGTLYIPTDGNTATKTAFLYNGSGYWDGIYFEPGSVCDISDVTIEYAKKALTFSPGAMIEFPSITDCQFNYYQQFGIDMNGAVGHTDITYTLFNDNLTSGEGVRIKNGFLNISDTTFLYHGSGLSCLEVIDATVNVGPDVYFQCGSQPGYAVRIQGNSDDSVFDWCGFLDGASGYEYIKVEGSSCLVDNSTFELGGGRNSILATYDIYGTMSHPLLRNPNPGSSFDNTTISVVSNSTVSLQWWLDVFVKDFDNNPIPNAPVWVKDAYGSPAQPYSKTTDATGWARWFTVTELVQYNGWRQYNNPFNISAENNSVMGYANLENSSVTHSRTSTVIIGPYPLLNNTLPVVSYISTPVGVQSGPVAIEFTLFDPDPGDDGNLSVDVLFWDPIDLMWLPATPHPTSDPTSGLYSAITYTFVWDSNDPKDFYNKYGTDVYIKIIPYDKTGVGTEGQTGNFTVDNGAPVIPSPSLNLMAQLPSGSMSDIELTWSPSPNDGGGENDVVGYSVYKSTTGVNGSYVFTAWISASNTTSYKWMDMGAGDGDWNNNYYKVVANTSSGMEEPNNDTAGKFVNNLLDGWNLISVPFVQASTDMEYVLQTIWDNLVVVQGYHAGKSRPWLHWVKVKPGFFNDDIPVHHKGGYYVILENPDHLVVAGRVATNTQIPLITGWNLVGYPCPENRTVAEALSSISGKYNIVDTYDPVTDKVIRLNASDYMEPGLGYWIHATDDCVWELSL